MTQTHTQAIEQQSPQLRRTLRTGDKQSHRNRDDSLQIQFAPIAGAIKTLLNLSWELYKFSRDWNKQQQSTLEGALKASVSQSDLTIKAGNEGAKATKMQAWGQISSGIASIGVTALGVAGSYYHGLTRTKPLEEQAEGIRALRNEVPGQGQMEVGEEAQLESVHSEPAQRVINDITNVKPGSPEAERFAEFYRNNPNGRSFTVNDFYGEGNIPRQLRGLEDRSVAELANNDERRSALRSHLDNVHGEIKGEINTQKQYANSALQMVNQLGGSMGNMIDGGFKTRQASYQKEQALHQAMSELKRFLQQLLNTVESSQSEAQRQDIQGSQQVYQTLDTGTNANMAR